MYSFSAKTVKIGIQLVLYEMSVPFDGSNK